MYTIWCISYFFTHFPVYLPSLFEYQNAALSYVDEADVIYLTYQFEFSEKTQVQICDDHMIKVKPQRQLTHMQT